MCMSVRVCVCGACVRACVCVRVCVCECVVCVWCVCTIQWSHNCEYLNKSTPLKMSIQVTSKKKKKKKKKKILRCHIQRGSKYYNQHQIDQSDKLQMMQCNKKVTPTHPYLLCCTQTVTSMHIHPSLRQLSDQSNRGPVFTNNGSNHLVGHKDSEIEFE